jgi:hypothetical protein
MEALRWTHSNLHTQGYCLTAEQARRHAVGLRFPTAVCLGLVAAAVALQSPVMLLALAVIGAFAGFGPRHPFDYIWNGAVRRLVNAPAVPLTPRRRRHAFKLATAWLVALAALFAAGANTVAFVLAGVLFAVCGAVTVFNFCVPSTMLRWWEGRRQPQEVASA